MEERPIVAGKKMPGEALEVKLHTQHPCEISAVPSLKNTSLKACTAQQESLLSIREPGANSWRRTGRLPLPERAETDSCPHVFQPFRAALKKTLLDCYVSLLIRAS